MYSNGYGFQPTGQEEGSGYELYHIKFPKNYNSRKYNSSKMTIPDTPPSDRPSRKYRRALSIVRNRLITSREMKYQVISGTPFINYKAKILSSMFDTSYDTFLNVAVVGTTLSHCLGGCGCSCLGRELRVMCLESDMCVHIIALFIDCQMLPGYDFNLRSRNNNND